MRITKAVLLLMLAAFVGVALASIHDEDWGVFWHTKNLCGPIGAHIAGALHYLFGPAFSWFWPLFIVFFAVLLFKDIEARSQMRRVICAMLLLVVVSAIGAGLGGSGAGGFVGVKTLGFLRLIAGRIGSGLILAAALLVVSFLLLPGAVESLLGRLRHLRLPLPARKRTEAAARQRKPKRERDVPEIPVIVEAEEPAAARGRGGRPEERRTEAPP
ncbi:MAG: DNA translocase FtsK 4TM domain-containing protein, partial [Candidatus Krumholzibacteriaceae bacterium]